MMMELMKAEVQLLVPLQICDVFFIELKSERMRQNVLFSLLLKLRPNPLFWPLTDGASTVYKATAHSTHTLVADQPSNLFPGSQRETNMSHAWGYGPSDGENICFMFICDVNKLLWSFDIKRKY